MADVTALIRTDHLQILRWQAVMGQLARQSRRPGSPARTPARAWGIMARLIDWHMSAVEQICGLAASQVSPWARRRVDNTGAVHANVREVLAETFLQPPASRPPAGPGAGRKVRRPAAQFG